MVVENWKDIDLTGVKGILLDLDNTLYAYDPVHKIAYEFCRKTASEEYHIAAEDFDSSWKTARNKVHEDLHGQGASHSRLLYFQKQHEVLFGRTNATYTLQMEELYWSVFLNHIQWKEGAQQFLQRATESNLEICIVTDLTAAIQFRKWNQMGLGQFVKYMVSSEEAGIEKPGKYIFEMALDKLKMKTEEVIMIGDNEKKDISGANALGIKSYLITDNTR